MLEVKNVSTFYGKIAALTDVSVHIKKGEIVSLIGANGAGKTTLLMTICGDPKPSQGQIIFEGRDITQDSTSTIMRGDIAIVPEGRRIFSRLTVEENLSMGAFFVNDKAEKVALMDEVFGLFPRLKERINQRAGTMSGGEQQMLAVARILRTGARLLLLDEISEGLAPVIVQALARMINTLRDKGYTIVMVEQNFRFAAPLADRFYVMEHGRIVETFNAAQLDAKMPVLNELLGV